jgi:hypothetical protein
MLDFVAIPATVNIPNIPKLRRPAKMTTSDEFSLLAEAPKDRWGRYKISDPASGKERGYTRVTTIAKVLDDSSSLADWKTRMAITGIVQRADLLAQASTSLDDRSKLNKIANDAIEAAGAYSRANLGTALHSITQQLDLGMKPQILAGLQSDIETYVASIAAWDFGMKKEWIEVLLINDEFEYAGTADRIVTTRDGKICIFDLKTGTDLSYSFGSIAVQLAMYANADWIYDWKTGERTALPEGLDMKEGIICHLPAGEANCKFYTVDLEAGWEAAKMSFATRNWRKRKDLFKPYKFSDEKQGDVEPVQNPIAQADNPVSPKELAVQQEWMKQRIANLTREAQAMLILCWPQGCPKLQETSADQLQQLVKVIQTVEAEHDIPFFDADPTAKKPVKRKIKGFDTAEIGSIQ